MPLSRVVSVALVVFVVIGLAWLVRGSGTVETEYLFGGRILAEQELDSVELTFSRAKLNGWQREDRRIRIPVASRADYLAALYGSAALPMSLRSSVQEAIDKASLFEPTSQRIARESHAKERDLGSRLSMFKEIRWATVEHDLGQRKGLSNERTQSASVVVCPEGDQPLSPAHLEMVREMIRGSYAGMQRDDIVVIDTNADPAVCPTNDPIARKQCQEEAGLEQKVSRILQDYGTIRVAAYLDYQAAANPPVPAGSSSSQLSSSNTHSGATLLSKRSRLSNQTQPNRSLLGDIIEAVTHVRSNRATRLESQSEPSRSSAKVLVSKISPDDAILQSARLSIGIPESYYQKVWRHRFSREHPDKSWQDAPALSADGLAKLQQATKASITTAVTPALMSCVRKAGSSEGHSYVSIDVWSFPDFSEQVQPAPSDVAPGWSWILQSWRPLTTGVLLCAIVFVLAGVLRSSGNRVRRSGYTSRSQTQDASVVSEPAGIDEELTSLVDRNPELAANAIRRWIGEAA